MLKKKLDGSKILLVLVCEDKAESERQIELIKKAELTLPEGHMCSIHAIIGKKNLAASFNAIQKKDNSKYKIYITTSVANLDRSIILKTVEAFFIAPKTAMVGTMGSELPISGDYTQAKNFYGLYSYNDGNGQVKQYLSKDPLYYQSVHMVESSFFATNEDIAWDEKIGDDFAVVAQCCNFRSKGYDVGVFYQEVPLLIFENDEFDYKPKADMQNYNKQLEKFFNLYKKKIQPLVSILIPAYNQPKFCQEALESALAQTYQNIEILVGDDSTNEDVKKMIRPYLKKHSNLKYFYHNGKIPSGGGANMLFLLNTCSGEYVNYLLHDDLFHPEKIYKMMQYYITDFESRIGLVTSARSLINENNQYVKRRNPWQPRSDAIVKGEDVGRRLLFIIANFIGELTTVLFRKKDVAVKTTRYEKWHFSTGIFCGVSSYSYGDMDTWLEILKTGKDMVFMSEALSAFRQHAAQNTFNPNTRITLPLDALNFITLAWINDIFFRDVREYHYCLDKWPILADRWFVPIKEDDSEEIVQRKEWILKLKETFLSGNYDKMTNLSIEYLLNCTHAAEVVSLIRRNPYTGLWERSKGIYTQIDNLDLCPNNIWKAHGTVSFSAKNAKFGQALQCNRSGIESSAIAFGGADFTVDFWGYISESAPIFAVLFHSALRSIGFHYPMFISRYENTASLDFGLIDYSLPLTLLEEVDNQIAEINPVDNLNHYEIDYDHTAQKIYLFVNGNLVYEKGEIFVERVGRVVSLGWHLVYGEVHSNVGAISEFRLSDGICRHTENFTPPSEPYEIDEYTVSLLHF